MRRRMVKRSIACNKWTSQSRLKLHSTAQNMDGYTQSAACNSALFRVFFNRHSGARWKSAIPLHIYIYSTQHTRKCTAMQCLHTTLIRTSTHCLEWSLLLHAVQCTGASTWPIIKNKTNKQTKTLTHNSTQPVQVCALQNPLNIRSNISTFT